RRAGRRARPRRGRRPAPRRSAAAPTPPGRARAWSRARRSAPARPPLSHHGRAVAWARSAVYLQALNALATGRGAPRQPMSPARTAQTILGLETSCDETAAAVVRLAGDGAVQVLSSVVASQIA